MVDRIEQEFWRAFWLLLLTRNLHSLPGQLLLPVWVLLPSQRGDYFPESIIWWKIVFPIRSQIFI
jgi:hypothetical protein